MLSRRLIVAVAVSLCCLAGPALAQDGGHISGQAVLDKISGAQGKVVVLNFFASWCKPCILEVPDFIEARSALPQDKVLMIGVSLDQDAGMYDRFVKSMKFNYPVYLADPDVLKTFGVSMIPRTLVYNAKGEQSVNHAGFMSGDTLKQTVDGLLKDQKG